MDDMRPTDDLVKKYPYMTVESEEWKRLWRQPCPFCRHTLLDHAKQSDMDELLQHLNRLLQSGLKPIPETRFEGERMTCINCGCFIPRAALFNQILESAETRVFFKKKETEALQSDAAYVPDDFETRFTGTLATLFTPVIGHDDVKKIFQYALLSQRPVHVILEGPPASAKSLFLMELGRLPSAHFVLGGTSSKAGLTDLLLTYRPRFLLIDEIETIDNSKDYAALLHLMENQEVVETKYHRSHDPVPMNTWVFAAGNDVREIGDALLSRFGGKEGVIRLRAYNPQEFVDVATKVLILREGVQEEFAGKVAKATLNLGSRDVRLAVRLARLTQDEEKLNEVVETLRRHR